MVLTRRLIPPRVRSNSLLIRRSVWAAFLTSISAIAAGCGSAGGGSSGNLPPVTPPPAPAITVGVSPTSGSLLLGATQPFTAIVSNTTNTAVTWNVNGVSGGSIAMGTISSAGLYTAPQIMPAQSSTVIQAVSQADPTKSGLANVTVTSDVALSLAPLAASIELGSTRPFAATVTSAGNPDKSVTWSVFGTGCAGAACGTVTASGDYTAPQVLPSPTIVTLIARSVADPSKTTSAPITITSSFTLTIAGPSSLQAGASAQYNATLTPAPNSNPSSVVSWSVSGASCSGAACGAITSSGSYTVPTSVASPLNVAISATPLADPSKSTSMQVTIQPLITTSVTVSPATASLAVTHRRTFSASVTGLSNSNVQWDVNGVIGGNTTVGQICAAASSPCQPASGATTVDYVAPAAVPAPNPVMLTATSLADPTRKSSASITILAHDVVSVSPLAATLAPASHQLFQASVAGTTNQFVTWQVSGAACANSACGTIDPTGLYLAPLAPPTPNMVTIVAISQDDSSRTGTATVTIGTGPAILTLAPASALAGSAGGFTLRVSGANFIASSPGPGSGVSINSAARTTTCPDANTCTTILTASELASAATLAVQVSNPNGASSNQVFFTVIADPGTLGVISLTPANPTATGKDITVVDLSAAGASTAGSGAELNVAALGFFSASTNGCNLAGNPLVISRPSSATATVDICVFSASGLDASMTYSIFGPSPNDISIIARQPMGLGIIRLTLQLSNSTQPGARSLLITNTNKDSAAASGAMQVK
jgi:hypothetical protein